MGGPGVAFECRCQAGMHINEDHYLAEIVDPETLGPLPEGEVGELVITTLATHRAAADPLPHARPLQPDLRALRLRPHAGAHDASPWAAATTCSSSAA